MLGGTPFRARGACLRRWQRAIAVAILAACPIAASAQSCKLVRVAEWTLTMDRNQPVVSGEINGRKAGILIDTGSTTTLIARSSARRLGLELQYVSGFETHGLGGASRPEMVEIDELRIGQAVRRKWRMLAVGEHDMGAIDVVLGEDFLENFDLELDFANKVARLFQPQGCERSPLSYWAPGATWIELERGRRISFPVKVDELPVRAMLDTGSTRTVLATQVVAQLGVTPSSPGTEPGGCMAGIGKRLVDGWIATMKSFSIGGETIHNPRLSFGDINAGAAVHEVGTRIARPVDEEQMILGADFLLAHRVMVAQSQRRLYFTHNGATVFTGTAAPTCTERATMTAQERAARLDAALLERPDDAELLHQRAISRFGKGDLDGALADYDRAIALRPALAEAIRERGALHSRRLELDQALEDYTRYLEVKPESPAALAQRGHVWRYKGDTQKARADYAAALRLDPHDKGALRGRGLLSFEDARYEDAQRDFAEWFHLDPVPYAALWVYLARLRGGQDGSRELFEYEHRKESAEWAHKLLRYQLGLLDADELLRTAATPAGQRQAQECEARFNIAERRLAAVDTAGALPLLRQARDECPRRFDEYFAATAELERLATPGGSR